MNKMKVLLKLGTKGKRVSDIVGRPSYYHLYFDKTYNALELPRKLGI
jgi:hypothetical protein